MDKASIIGDAVLYVQNLQGQAKKLKAEIAEFEASLAANPGLHQQTTERNSKRIPVLVSKQLMQVRSYICITMTLMYFFVRSSSILSGISCLVCRWMSFKWRRDHFM